MVHCGSERLLLAVVFLFSASEAFPSVFPRHVMTYPHSALVAVGSNLTALCVISNTTEIGVDDLSWSLKGTVPKDQYRRVNATALSVTVTIPPDAPGLLLCKGRLEHHLMEQARFQHATYLEVGYRPVKPENLSCVAEQQKYVISPDLHCSWKPLSQSTKTVPTTHTLMAKYSDKSLNVSSGGGNKATLRMDAFPNHVTMEVWVEVTNRLGTVHSDHMVHDANAFVKTNPPQSVHVISEQSFPSSLLINWTRPIHVEYMELIYRIRYAARRSPHWTYVSQEDLSRNVQSFRLQKLLPDTLYSIQLSCKFYEKDLGYWSDWSSNATARTPEDRPGSRPDVWRILEGSGEQRKVHIVSKNPVQSNGVIRVFKLQVQRDRVRDSSAPWDTFPAGCSSSSSSSSPSEEDSGRSCFTFLTSLPLESHGALKVFVTAANQAGKSPEASIGFPNAGHDLSPLRQLRVWPEDGVLWVEWSSANQSQPSEYVVEWSDGRVDWQRENGSTTRTFIRGGLQNFVQYRVSVYPLYSGWLGTPLSQDAFLRQGAPSKGPNPSLDGSPGPNQATIKWAKISGGDQRGFITHYLLCYTRRGNTTVVVLDANATSYTLRGLDANTQYDVLINATTVVGSTSGNKLIFSTLRYHPGELEGILVGVSLGVVFLFFITAAICFTHRHSIKRNLWPDIPDPGESTIGAWTPDCPLKVEGVSAGGGASMAGVLLAVSVCESGSVWEEPGAALKKDFLSEEHSSGIGGSSCMSSPRHSVSDSDEGDAPDSTAATVQYSSVVASGGGYKGQTPPAGPPHSAQSSQLAPPPQPPQSLFSRSESTQPLLDGEENPDLLDPRAPPRFPPPQSPDALSFCPLEEDGGTAASSYMPQRGGYRPQ